MARKEVEITPLAFAKIIDWVSSNTEREVGGYMIGKVMKDSVVITDATFAVAESNPAYVALDNMAQFRIIEEIEKRGTDETIIGFWHSHPGLGCFMSGTDIATQRIYQSLLPASVAMVNDGNAFARSRSLADFEAHFYRVNGKEQQDYHEVSFNVITDPNKLLNNLVSHVQAQENPEKIAEKTATKMAFELRNTLRQLSESLLTEEQFTKEHLKLKKAIDSACSDIESIDKQLISKDFFSDQIKKTEKTTKELQKSLNVEITKQRDQLTQLTKVVFGSTLLAILSLIAVITLLILTLLS
ncbi:MAG: hypothetical protein GF308_13195 [Candidatus Heimdallarchaeota archaeon]|nr:hypothetical protein [Candidatus Heimdallarchaeota archaeon]